MKTILRFLSVLLLLFCIASIPAFVGCGTPSQQRVTVDTLKSIHVKVDAQYQGFLLGVIRNEIPKTGLPSVANAYNAFQKEFKAGVMASLMNSNAVAPMSVSESALAFQNTVIAAKKGTP